MDAKHTGKIYGINGPVIYLKGRTGFKMSEMVYVDVYKRQLWWKCIKITQKSA